LKDDYKVAVLGGTGKAGHYVINELIKQGYSVKMLVRNPDKAPGKNPLIEVVTGSAKNYVTMQYLLTGCNAVISTLGPSKSEQNICSIAVGHITKIMTHTGIKRYVEIAGLAIETPEDKKGFLTRFIVKIIRTFFRRIAEDRQKVYSLLTASKLNWTIVRCPMIELTDSRRTLKIKAEDSPGRKVSAADLADFLVKQITDDHYFGKCPFVSS
jgi:putative NADH-flavin reductase